MRGAGGGEEVCWRRRPRRMSLHPRGPSRVIHRHSPPIVVRHGATGKATPVITRRGFHECGGCETPLHPGSTAGRCAHGGSATGRRIAGPVCRHNRSTNLPPIGCNFKRVPLVVAKPPASSAALSRPTSEPVGNGLSSRRDVQLVAILRRIGRLEHRAEEDAAVGRRRRS